MEDVYILKRLYFLEQEYERTIHRISHIFIYHLGNIIIRKSAECLLSCIIYLPFHFHFSVMFYSQRPSISMARLEEYEQK